MSSCLTSSFSPRASWARFFVEVNEQLAEILRGQHGVANRFQVATTSTTKAELETLIRRGVLRTRPPNLVVLAAAPNSWTQRAMIAAMSTHPDAMVSHGSAARLHELDGFTGYTPMHVTVRHGVRPTTPKSLNVTVHQTRAWAPGDAVRISNIPVRNVPLTLIDILATLDERRTVMALDSALRNGVTIEHIQHVVAGRVRQGRKGPIPLLLMLDQRTNKRLPRSWFQRLASELLAANGLRFDDEVPVHTPDGKLLAELDLALPALKIGVECQSWRWHATPDARRKDAQRKRALRRLGWEIVEVWWADLDRMAEVADTVRVIIDERVLKLDV